MEIYCDVGLKNFCYILIQRPVTLLDFEICSFQKSTVLEEVCALLEKLIQKGVTVVNVERQLAVNTLCLKIETAIKTFCILKNITFKSISAKEKNSHLMKTCSYYQRKKQIVLLGLKLLENITYENEIVRTKVQTLINGKKKDDFFDCICMFMT
jgi:hypothetical protein